MERVDPLTIPEYVRFSEEYDAYIAENYVDNGHILAMPLLDCLSVNIITNDGNSSQVCGRILVTDAEGTTFTLYNRKEDDLETLSNGDPLTLTFPSSIGRAISPSGQVKVDVLINDKSRNDIIASGHFIWDYSVKDVYDEVQSERVPGQCGYADIRYITYRHAVIATVEVLVRGKSEDAFDVYGNIIAHCGKTSSSTLLKKTHLQPVRVKSGDSIDLSRHVVAVPAHSFLEIEAEMWIRDTNSQTCCKDRLRFPVTTNIFAAETEQIEGENGLIEVGVRWSHLYMKASPERKSELKFEEAFSEVNTTDKNQQEKEKKPQLLSDQGSSSDSSVERNYFSEKGKEAVIIDGISLTEPVTINGDTLLLELFSVLIRSNNDEGFDLWGTIKVDHWTDESLIFSRDKASSESWLSNRVAPIIGPTDHCFTACSRVEIKLKLKDAKDRVISLGNVIWDWRVLERIPWIGRPLCSVVPGNLSGDTGYAAVHYMLFYDGLQAVVKVSLVGKSSSTDRPQVYGSVFTEYDNRKYITKYDRDHYRSRLFLRHTANPEVLSSDFEVPLTKSVVAVPLNSSLIVDLDLSITYPAAVNGNGTADDALKQSSENFRGRLKFSIHDGSMLCKSCGKIDGSCKSIVAVSVEGKNKVCLTAENLRKKQSPSFPLRR